MQQSLLINILVVSTIGFAALATAADKKSLSDRVVIDGITQNNVLQVVQTGFPSIKNIRKNIEIREAFKDEFRFSHVRLKQTHEGVPVLFGDLIAHFNKDGVPGGVSGQYFNDIGVSVVPTVASDRAQELAVGETGLVADKVSPPELLILPHEGAFYLVYRIEVSSLNQDEPASRVVFVNARPDDPANGLGLPIIFSYSSLETQQAAAGDPQDEPQLETGVGFSIYSGRVKIRTTKTTTGAGQEFSMIDDDRNATINQARGSAVVFKSERNKWGSKVTKDNPPTEVSAGVDAHYGAALTYRYYKEVHGRKGITGTGDGLNSFVHYGKQYNNAYWSNACFCMTYGDGDGKLFSPLVSLDVVGHEISHGLTSNTARLAYYGESGGLNEATSDIFGTAVEFFANNKKDKPDWTIGEEVYLPAPYRLRNMADPSEDKRSIDHYSKYYSGLDVHYSSGIANNFFYLLSVGGTNKTSGMSVSGIGLGKAEKIWFLALTTRMTAGSKFVDARRTTLEAAGIIHGEGSPEQLAVASAWTAVGVN